MTTRSISSRQAAVFVLSSMIGVGILTLPRPLITKAGTHAWLPVMIGGLFPLLGLWLQVTLCRRHPHQNFSQMSKSLLGTLMGSLVTAAFIAYAMMVSAITCRSFVDLLSTVLFLRTPRWALILLFMVTSANAVQFGARVLARINELLFYLLLPILLFLLPALRYAHLANLRPVLQIDMAGVVAAVPTTAYAYLGYEVLMFIYWLVEDQRPVLRHSLWGALFTVGLYIHLVIVVLLILGPQLASKFTYPTLTVVRTVELPVLDRLDLLALGAYITLVFRPCTNYYLIVADTTARLVGKEPSRLFVWLLALPLSLLATLPRNVVAVDKMMTLIGQVGLGLSFGVPLVLLIVSKLRGAHEV